SRPAPDRVVRVATGARGDRRHPIWRTIRGSDAAAQSSGRPEAAAASIRTSAPDISLPGRDPLDGDIWKMEFALTRDQQAIADSVRRLCEPFDDAYWLERDRVGGYPVEFHRALADAGWLGICMPEAYGGSGL